MSDVLFEMLNVSMFIRGSIPTLPIMLVQQLVDLLGIRILDDVAFEFEEVGEFQADFKGTLKESDVLNHLKSFKRLRGFSWHSGCRKGSGHAVPLIGQALPDRWRRSLPPDRPPDRAESARRGVSHPDPPPHTPL